jgi:SAM-dependent methyltransferase
MPRHATTTDLLERSERAWWAEHAEVEDRWCWVQTPAVQHAIRGRYTRRIASWIRPDDVVVEVGCGTGWLALLLAEAGVRDLTGLDFAPEQIDRARASAAAVGALGAGLRFEVGGLGDLAARDRPVDVVVLHAFLHHLATDEIERVLAEVAAVLAPGGRLVLFEPALDPTAPPGRGVADRVLRGIERLPMALAARHLRRVSDAERAVRAAVDRRGVGEWPFGPSPKEVPFAPGELAELLAGAGFEVQERTAEMSRAGLVAQELLVAELSQPRLWRTLMGPLLRLASACDRRVVGRPRPPGDGWVFELLRCGRAAADAR